MSPDAYLEMAETEHTHWWFAGRRAVVTGLLSRLSLPPDARIIEIGCGTGGNLDMLSAFGRVSALEMSDVARNIATTRTNGRFQIHAGSAPDDLPVLGEKFDLICLIDVLEHIEDDIGTLAVLRGMLAEGGRIMITVPAYRWLWSRHDEFLHHKRRYTAAELKSKAALVGLSATRISYYNTLLFPVAALMRLQDRLFKREIASGTSVPPRLINALFRRIFSGERYLLNAVSLPFGVSLFAILAASESA